MATKKTNPADTTTPAKSDTAEPKRTRRQRTAEERMVELETRMRVARLRAAADSIEDPEVVEVVNCLRRVYSAQGKTVSAEAGKTLGSAAKPLETYLQGLGIEL